MKKQESQPLIGSRGGQFNALGGSGGQGGQGDDHDPTSNTTSMDNPLNFIAPQVSNMNSRQSPMGMGGSMNMNDRHGRNVNADTNASHGPTSTGGPGPAQMEEINRLNEKVRQLEMRTGGG